MSTRVQSMVWDRFKRGGSEKLAMLALADWCDDHGGNLFPSIAGLAEKMSCSEVQARRILHGFIDEGLVVVVGNVNGGKPGATRRYRINLALLNEGVHEKRKTGLTGESRTGLTGERGTGLTDESRTGLMGDRRRVSPVRAEPSTNHQKEKHTSARGAPGCGGSGLKAGDENGGGQAPPDEAQAAEAAAKEARICRALAAQGITNALPGHRLMRELLQAGAEEAEFLAAAPLALKAEAGDLHGYVLGVVVNRRKAAAKVVTTLRKGALPVEDKPAAEPWWKSGPGVRRMGVELGLGDWDECEQYPTYRARVLTEAKARGIDGPWSRAAEHAEAA